MLDLAVDQPPIFGIPVGQLRLVDEYESPMNEQLYPSHPIQPTCKLLA